MVKFCVFIGRAFLAIGAVLVAACTATEQKGETAAPSAAPTEVRTDADRRAIYNNGVGTNSAVPDATPNRVRLGEQAADINRQKRIENVNSNDPNNTPPETRINRLRYDPPVDTLRRRP
ncbi:hypothetical protein AUC43_00330 [Hymenobacter sedentarius]|uniref:Lipoprotein n=1 Tax=Hymenobacter sedentarius TaxID=1411621 RepID=A0A0U3SBY2_9BACT|nr:hypothetical protein [Hymenobacter sedentarius]ALW83684.1 hypothetical protein AUC43_00330 [Hymenobacter sedentarius]